MKNFILKRCSQCGACVKVLQDCTCDECGVMCCGEVMTEVKANSVDASFEKHIPSYEIVGDKLTVTVNHVMDENHYIEWICFCSGAREEFVYFTPGEEAKTVFDLQQGGILYAYCNQHCLWRTEVTL